MHFSVKQDLERFPVLHKATARACPDPRALSRHLSLATTSGVLVLSVEKDSPAEKAGVLEGDVIVGMDGAAIQGVDDLHAHLADQKIGAESQLTVIRRTTKITLHVFPEEMRPVA